jgi:hypothetical protein
MEGTAAILAASVPQRLVNGIHGPPTAGEMITQLEPNDVLMGRGAPVANYAGNVLFQQLVSTRKFEYSKAGQHAAKQVIARQVYAKICQRGGRFLSKLAPVTVSVTKTTVHNHWYVADKQVALEKVKQALRNKHDFVEPPSAASAFVVAQMVADTQRLERGLLGETVRAAELDGAAANNVTPSGSFLR